MAPRSTGKMWLPVWMNWNENGGRCFLVVSAVPVYQKVSTSSLKAPFFAGTVNVSVNVNVPWNLYFEGAAVAGSA
jgi:hypothetical protein